MGTVGIALVAAPTNLGLRPPVPGAVPGTAKAPEALREAGVYRRMAGRGATDAGVVLPGRYLDDFRPGSGRIRNQEAIVDHAYRLADRLGTLIDAGRAPLVLGGDCSLLVGAGLALTRRSGAGLVHVDGHTDFRHGPDVHALAGEDLAAAVGLHLPAIADLEGLGPYFRPDRVAHVGCRNDDTALDETTSLLGAVLPASVVLGQGAAAAAARAREVADGPGGYWLHVDVDVLDPTVLPAVDSPDAGGIDATQLTELLASLAPGAVGAEVTVFDPDLDPDGQYARLVADVVVEGLGALGRDLA